MQRFLESRRQLAVKFLFSLSLLLVVGATASNDIRGLKTDGGDAMRSIQLTTISSDWKKDDFRSTRATDGWLVAG